LICHTIVTATLPEIVREPADPGTEKGGPMGDHFEYRLTSLSVLPFNAPAGAGPLPWGTRLSPSGQWDVGNFSLHLRLEGGAAQASASPAGSAYFESNPSGTISRDTLIPNYVRRPDPNERDDTLRANAALRGLWLGYRFNRDWSLRFGRNRYEVGPLESTFMTQSFSQASHYANLYLPYGWLGGEIRFDRERSGETLRRSLVTLSVMNGAEHLGGALGVLQFNQVIAFAPGAEAPRLSLMGYVGWRSNPEQPDNARIVDSGQAWGLGFGSVFEYAWFLGGASFVYQDSHWGNRNGLSAGQERSEETFFAVARPGRFRMRAAISWLEREDWAGMNPFDTAGAGQSEKHWELNFGYEVLPGVAATLGYIGMNRDNATVHMGFLGLQTYYEGRIPF